MAPIRRGTTLALLAWGASLAWIIAIDDPRLRFARYLVGAAVASIAWIFLILVGTQTGFSKRELRLVVGFGLAARLAFVFVPPAHSDDVFRHVYEGRVVWSMGPAFPFQHPPADAPDLGVPRRLLDASWRRVNHPQLATIYPPAAALVFDSAAGLGELAGGGHLLILKLMLVAAELSASALVFFALEWLGLRGEGAVVAFLSPLVVLEVAREGHADALCLLGLALGAYGAARERPLLGVSGFSLALLAKMNGLLALFAALRSTRRGLFVALAAAALLSAPYILAGTGEGAGLVAYAGTWRSGDGAFSLLLALSERALGGDARVFFGRILSAQVLARAAAALCFVAIAARVLWNRPTLEEVPGRAALLVLALLLLSPTLHPWYATWLLPLAPFARTGRASMIALAALAPLLHHASFLELVDGQWQEIPWVRGLVHGPTWAFLLRDLFWPSPSG